ncbi:MAG: hypothetical protein AAFY59_06140, partial [Pseudomonadota bacterium]
DEGQLRPLVQIRDSDRTAMGNSGLHCTGSTAADWPRDDQTMTAENFFADEALGSIEADFGLDRSNIEGSLHMMGLVREHARLGKPQIFYYGLTNVPADELIKFRLDKQRQMASSSKYADMTEGQFKDLIMRDIWSEDAHKQYPFTHEAEAMLTVLGREFGNYDEL